jgi:uncharacterized membrane protein YozB (DUF420 family)
VTGPTVILTLKVAVGAVTVLLVCSLVAIARGNRKLHGRINLAFFVLTLAAVLGLEVVIRLVNPKINDHFREHPDLHRALTVHLCFSVPALLLMPLMLYTGLTRRRSVHLTLAVLFGVAWAGTFITGIFFLPTHPQSP